MGSPSPDFFIVGSPRSGTTLVQRLLMECQGVSIPPETHFFSVFAPTQEWRFPLDAARLHRHLGAYADLTMSPISHNDIPPIVDTLAGTAATVFDLFAAIVDHLTTAGDLIGEKTPHHLLWLRQLSRIYPASKFVWVVRDPRAIVESNRRMPFGMTSVTALAGMWRSDQSVMSTAASQLGDRVMQVRYEDVIAAPDEMRLSLAAHIGLPDPPVRRSVDLQDMAAAQEYWKGEVAGPIRDDRNELWKENLPEDSVRVVEAICGRPMRKLGYEPSRPTPARLKVAERLLLARFDLGRTRRLRSIAAMVPAQQESPLPLSAAQSEGSQPKVASGDSRCVIYVSASGHLAGPARSLLTVIRTESKAGFRQILIAPGGDLLAEASGISGLEQIQLPLKRRVRRAYRLWGSLLVAREIWRRRASVAAIHANGLSELNLVGLGASFARCHVVVWSHASLIANLAPRMAQLWRRTIRSLDWSAVSSDAAQALADRSIADLEAIAIIPNPISAGEVAAEREDRRGPVRIGFLSGATRNKGFDVLVEASELLEDLDLEWLLFTNPKGKRADIDLVETALSRPNVRAIGHVSDVAQAYAQMDIAFVPSRRESFGRVAAEAMLNGIPVVASDIPAMRRLIGDDAGLLFPPGNADLASEQIRRLVADPDLRHRVGQAGPNRVGAFSPDTVRGALDRLYTHSDRDSESRDS